MMAHRAGGGADGVSVGLYIESIPWHPPLTPLLLTAVQGSGAMAREFEDIITRLERQKTRIERALSALREVEGVLPPGTPTAAAPKEPIKTKRQGHLAKEGRARLIAALKKRWADKKAAASVPPTTKKAAGK